MVAFAYLYVFPYQETINNPNENARFYMTAAIAEEGRYEVGTLRQRWGWVNDCAVYEGRIYSVKAPGTSLLGVPAYFAYHRLARAFEMDFDRTTALWLCRVSASILPLLFFLLFFHRWLGRRTRSALARDGVFISLALGSCLFGYGILFMSHTLSAAAAFVAFAWLWDAREAGRITASRAFGAGLCAAGVTFFEYPGAFASALLSLMALWAVRPRPRLILFIAGAALPTLAVMHFQWAAFDNPFSPGHLYVETDALRTRHEEGFFGATGVQPEALYGLFAHPGAGLFPLTPLLVAALPGLAFALRDRAKRAPTLFAFALVLSTTLLIASMNNWRGGWTLGPRYLVLIYPFLGLWALDALAALERRWPRTALLVVIAATLVGLLLSGVPSAYYPHLPPEVDRPLTQVIRVLIAHDYAPYTAGSLLGVHGGAAMWPMVLVFLGSLTFLLSLAKGWRRRALGFGGGVLVAALVAVPLLIDPRPGSSEVADALALITRSWTPAGHDRASRLSRELSMAPTPEGYERLAAIYEREGRHREARRARASAARSRRD